MGRTRSGMLSAIYGSKRHLEEVEIGCLKIEQIQAHTFQAVCSARQDKMLA